MINVHNAVTFIFVGEHKAVPPVGNEAACILRDEVRPFHVRQCKEKCTLERSFVQ